MNVAGFSVQNLGPGQSQIAMRGVSAGQIVRDQPGVKEQVGVYLDESVISLSLFTPDLDLFDISRIEVLRGPQGTLFGSGSLAGTVRYITNPPAIGVTEAAGEFGVSAIHSGGFGNDAKFAVNIPLGEVAAARITAYNTTIGGFMDAVQPDLSFHENVNNGRRTGARVALRLQPNDQFSITPRLHYQDIAMDGWNRIDAYNILANPYTTTRPAMTLGARQHFTQVEEPFADTFLLGDVTVAYDFGGVAVTAITSLTTRDVQVVRDATALGASISFSPFGAPEAGYTLDMPLIDETTATGLTQELRVASASDTERVAWVLGAFYSTAEREYGQSARTEDYVAVNSGAVSDFLRVVTGSPDLVWAGSRTLAGHPGTEELFFSDLTYDFNQLALFGEVSLAVTDRFSLTGGLRWYDFDERRTQTFDGLFADPLDSDGTTTAAGVAPRVIASYAVTEATQVNAQVSKGFRLGGINDPLNTPLCTPRDLETFGDRPTWDNETLWNYEVGTKSTVLGGRGTVNVSGFYMDIRNLQATVTAGSCSSRVPDARSAGLKWRSVRLEFPILSGESAPPVWRQPNVDHVGSWRATAPRRPAAPSRHVCSVRCSTATRYPPNARRTEAQCTRLSVLARHAAVAVERLAASGRLPVACVAVSARQTAASVAVGRARGDHWPDERVALPRGVVVYPRGAEPGLARPARRRRRCLQGRPPVGRAAGSRAACWRPHGVPEDGVRSRQRGAGPRPQQTRILWWGTSHRMLSRFRPASRHAPRSSSRCGSSPPVW